MSHYDYGGWAPYVPVAQRRLNAAAEAAKLRKKGHPVAPVVIEGRTIARTVWGKAWCDNLESYQDFEYRLDRGRSYVRNGAVVDLQIAPREVTALVSGSDIYKIKVSIGGVGAADWAAMRRDCAGGIDSLIELLQGRLAGGVMERLCRQQGGLFPKPAEMKFSCSCPDWATMCKHVAAVMYGIGARLDTAPDLLFRLRAVDPAELVTDLDAALPGTRKAPAAKVLKSDDLSALFGLEMAEEEAPKAAAKPKQKAKAKSPPPLAGGGGGRGMSKRTPSASAPPHPNPPPQGGRGRKPADAPSAPLSPKSSSLSPTGGLGCEADQGRVRGRKPAAQSKPAPAAQSKPTPKPTPKPAAAKPARKRA